MTMIYLINETDADHLVEVAADMARLGAPTIRAYNAGDHLIAFEGSHRLRAAEMAGIAVNIVEMADDDMIDLDTLDYDDCGWFDERVVPVSALVARLADQGFDPCADITVA